MSVETVDWDGLMERVRPMLPKGAVVLSPADVEKVREWHRQSEKLSVTYADHATAAYEEGRAKGYRDVLSLVCVQATGKEA